MTELGKLITGSVTNLRNAGNPSTGQECLGN